MFRVQKNKLLYSQIKKISREKIGIEKILPLVS